MRNAGQGRLDGLACPERGGVEACPHGALRSRDWGAMWKGPGGESSEAGQQPSPKPLEGPPPRAGRPAPLARMGHSCTFAILPANHLHAMRPNRPKTHPSLRLSNPVPASPTLPTRHAILVSAAAPRARLAGVVRQPPRQLLLGGARAGGRAAAVEAGHCLNSRRLVPGGT